jgi:hypothetical protein
LGTVNKKSLIRSDTAQPGDAVLAAIDLDGHFHSSFETAWDTTTSKSKDDVETRFEAMHIIADSSKATAAKDISNPGVVGTLGMLLDVSDMGGEIELTKIPKPAKVDMMEWLKAYPGFGVVLTTSSDNADSCISDFHRVGIDAAIVGKVDKSRELRIVEGGLSVQVFDFRRDRLSGKP